MSFTPLRVRAAGTARPCLSGLNSSFLDAREPAYSSEWRKRRYLAAQADPGKQAERLQEDAKDQANDAMDQFEDSLESKPASEVLDKMIGMHKYALRSP